ncbi:MAG TPA: type I restriction enzyme HsdR N-terminal domain-containing protein [Flavisolibacter sp.]|nr:type I restriction enzyme HsdR N-terminal domain-containing protein [Flavisolibacter sp.]
MITVPFPPPEFRLKRVGEKQLIFDAIRKKWLSLTGEEWVRQNFIAYLTSIRQYPLSYITVEKELTVNEMKKRFDILVYNKSHQPWLLVECKAQQVSLGENVLQQALRYHLTIPVDFIVITNGSHTLAWKKEGGRLRQIEEIPLWPEA